MAREPKLPGFLIDAVTPPPRGLLVTRDPNLARAFRRELRRCSDCSVSFDVQSSFREARLAAGIAYQWVALDLDSTVSPSDSVRSARRSWPAATIAVLSCWWSERDATDRERTDVVIHKPLRSPELVAFLRSGNGASAAEALQGEPRNGALAAVPRQGSRPTLRG